LSDFFRDYVLACGKILLKKLRLHTRNITQVSYVLSR
jgi:hypothetical protein